jgi:hypothetical protein
MLLKSRILAMSTPSNQVYKALYNTFWNKRSASAFDQTLVPMLKGASAGIFENKADLVALRPAPSQDRLTKILQKYLAFFFLSQETSANGRVGYVSEQKIDAFVGVVNVLLAAAFLFGAMYNLYYVRDERKTLGLVTGYTTAFAMTMWLLTNARRAEVFGACAAYAAVLVVFVSGNLGNGKECCCPAA